MSEKIRSKEFNILKLSKQIPSNDKVFEWARKLNNRQYRKELSDEEEQQLKQDRLVVVFGASDDLAELRGFIHDEIGAYKGGYIYFDKNKNLIESDDRFEDFESQIEFMEEYGLILNNIEVKWCETKNCSWTYNTEIPHATFNIYDDDDLYCIGIIFSIDEI